MKYKCGVCGKEFNEKVLEHGVFRGNFIKGHKSLKCKGKLHNLPKENEKNNS